MELSIEQFIRDAADTPIKIEILIHFLEHSKDFLSTDDLARRLGRDLAAVRAAVEALAAVRAINYCRSFGVSDVCYLQPCSTGQDRQDAAYPELRVLREVQRKRRPAEQAVRSS